MKRLSLGAAFEIGLLTILLIIVIHAPLSVAFGSVLPEYSTVFKAWKEILLTVLGMMALVLIHKNDLWRKLVIDRLSQLAFAFIGLHILLALLQLNDIYTVVAGLMIDLRFVAIFMLMRVLMMIRPESLMRIVKVIIAGALIVVGFGVLQITVLPDDILEPIGYSETTIAPFITIDRNPDFVRINSTLRGPNPLGALMVVYIALLAAYIVRKYNKESKKKLLYVGVGIIASGAVLFASFSRSAYVAVVVAIIAVLTCLRKVSQKVVIAGVAGIVIAGSGLWLVSSTDWYSNVILHVDPESPVAAKSNDGHVESLKDGATRVMMQPFGAGIGSTGSASLYDDNSSNDLIIENNYFFIAHESGWLGLALFLGLFGLLLYELWVRRTHWLALGLFASGLGLAVIAVLLPVWVDETVALIWWGLAGAVSTSGIIKDKHATRTRKQKATRTV